VSSPQLPNRYGPPVSLAAARRVCDAALAKAAQDGWTVAVAVVDPAGDLVCFACMDHTQRGSIEVALEKARCAARFKRPTKAWEDRLGTSPAILGLPGVLPLQGGVPLLSADLIVGAIGVSGALPAEDSECAAAGSAVV
jgi:glc operon protein GlcG